MDTSEAHPRRRCLRTVSWTVLLVLTAALGAMAVRWEPPAGVGIRAYDGGVWVANGQLGALGRLHVDAGALDARVDLVPGDIGVVQSGYRVLALTGDAALPVDTARILLQPALRLVPEAQVAVAGDAVLVAFPAGQVWLLVPSQLSTFDPLSTPPALTTSTLPFVALAEDGTGFVLDGSTLVRLDNTAGSTAVEVRELGDIDGLSADPDRIQLSVVGDEPIILDQEMRMLRVGSEGTPVPVAPPHDLSGAVLQRPGPSSAKVLVATADELLEVPLDDHDQVRTHAAGGAGEAAPPERVDGCAHAVWNGSLRYVRACGADDPSSGPIPGAEEDGSLGLRVNGGLVVIDDARHGRAWLLSARIEAVVLDWSSGPGRDQDDEGSHPMAAAPGVRSTRVPRRREPDGDGAPWR